MTFDSTKEYEKWLADQLKEKATKEKVVPKPTPKPKTVTKD
jgi:hypothetical protein